MARPSGRDKIEAGLEEAGPDSSKVLCSSKRKLYISSAKVVAIVDNLSEKLFDSDEFQSRIKKRFKEIYEHAVHENVSINDKTWSEAVEEGSSTLEFEPVDSERKNVMVDMALELDNLIVGTTAKRKEQPKRVTHQLGRHLKALRKSVAQFSPKLESKVPRSTAQHRSTKAAQNVKSKLEESTSTLSQLSKDLPVLEEKASRVQQVLDETEEMTGSSTQRIIQKPTLDEATMASSLTPLRKRLRRQSLTPTPIKDYKEKDMLATLRVRQHVIGRYRTRSSSAKIK